MGQQHSKDEQLYQQVNCGNVEGIKLLCRQGASLEWVDKEGKTPLIASCTNPRLHNVAKALLELGANANSYRPGRHAGTPLHHAAKKGFDHTVSLLLSHGANPLIINDDCQTPLDLARVKGFTNVVRAIEGHICLFSGRLRQFHGPGFLGNLAPQLISRQVWAVIIPCGAINSSKTSKLELALYHTSQDSRPHTVIALWKAHFEWPNFDREDPIVIIHDHPTKTRIKLGCLNESEKQSLRMFCDSFKATSQARPSCSLRDNPASAPVAADDLELAMALSASIHSANAVEETRKTSVRASAPSAPPFSDEIGSRIIGAGIGSFIPMSPSEVTEEFEKREGGAHASCVVCLDAPIEAVCVPCGHMAGCLCCLTEIKAKNWGCPVCRATIHQVVRLYSV